MHPVCPAGDVSGMGEFPDIAPTAGKAAVEGSEKVVPELWIETRITHRFFGYE
ncbi:hypothetical protein GCM10010470_49490 [Saccharopolyspora taberi]|uniref:Uncharacterized protein n=1 Tax=Saccharopolyspora taberi TaxID=60895 RepID=A0ABN3VIF4_9PSEU